MDLRVYHYGARGVFEGTRPVYGPGSGLGWPMHYRYPPLFLLLFAPLAMLPLGWAAAIWVVGKVAVLVVLLRALERRLKPATTFGSQNGHQNGPRGPQNGPPKPQNGDQNVVAGFSRRYAVIISFLLITPYLVEEFRYGNAQFFVVALTAASLLLVREKPVLSAASLALGISIKVWPLFFVPYLAARRDWKVAGYTLGFVVLLAILPSLYFGFFGNVDLLGQWFSQESQTQLGNSEIWFPNQSLRGLLTRYLTVVDYSQVPDSNYPQVHIAALDPGLVRWIWLIVAAAAYTALLVAACRRRNTNGWLDHGLAFCLLPLLEPFTQKYALAVLLWPALIAGFLIAKPGLRIFIYLSIVLALVQPLAPGSATQRLLQVLGLDFAVTLFLAAAIAYAGHEFAEDSFRSHKTEKT